MAPALIGANAQRHARIERLLPLTGEGAEDLRHRVDPYRETLARLHAQRQLMLRRKRLGDPQFSEEELEELRGYIDLVQSTAVALEQHHFDQRTKRVEQLATALLSKL